MEKRTIKEDYKVYLKLAKRYEKLTIKKHNGKLNTREKKEYIALANAVAWYKLKWYYE